MHASSKPTGRSAHRRTIQVFAGLLLAIALALTGCTNAGDGGGDSDSGAAGADDKAAGLRTEGNGKSASGSKADREQPELTGTHIIRTAKLTVRVDDVAEALDDARRAAEDAGGIVGNENTSRDSEGRERSRVVLRVPQDKYEDVLSALEGTGKLVGKDAKAQDVTDRVVDVESRITSQRASVARVRELMDRATKLSDVVTLEGELSTRQSDLEALLAQQKSLKDRTSLATITLSLTENGTKADTQDDDPSFGDALGGGWDAFVTALRWIAIVLAAVLPFAAVVALLVLLWLRVVRPRWPRRAAGGGEGED
ncbi:MULTISPECIES: DUF4349 domain-containing protein [Streptomyces]|uniref:DUF4349 domain-containing protein n=1 Tax=Streptomyces venezuelae TaxID=54571 RepID=A0A5P2BJB0_STRVZ|nr:MULTISPECIES: DUF4349 domain-containing protein [Streptomyces]NEA00939.1 DUF4349 domain-containing protein [Streptomyces sp. SID10116]MYY81327.1 DUF4349 domain-containing protein [Streptomyces sp. SID335]MYZ16167.1 DUF4349 domain-containing protein [Streptomyces sp. SID337]NDZ86369.1 DUF4349 domain-containing protein [Streptomyces sp. SID10115]NEB46641.1 DUF4349 domain-containing protein [Streptomyces sp. SID339]